MLQISKWPLLEKRFPILETLTGTGEQFFRSPEQEESGAVGIGQQVSQDRSGSQGGEKLWPGFSEEPHYQMPWLSEGSAGLWLALDGSEGGKTQVFLYEYGIYL